MPFWKRKPNVAPVFVVICDGDAPASDEEAAEIVNALSASGHIKHRAPPHNLYVMAMRDMPHEGTTGVFVRRVCEHAIREYPELKSVISVSTNSVTPSGVDIWVSPTVDTEKRGAFRVVEIAAELSANV